MKTIALSFAITAITLSTLVSAPTKVSYLTSSEGTPIVIYEYAASDLRLSWRDYPTPRSGTIIWEVDGASGKVLAARMLQSTGDKKLDDVAVQIARRWRFKPRTVSKVRCPVVFTKSGIKIG